MGRSLLKRIFGQRAAVWLVPLCVLTQSHLLLGAVNPNAEGRITKAVSSDSDQSASQASLPLTQDLTGGSIPIFTGVASLICAGVKYLDRSGDIQEGTKNCAGLSDAERALITPGNIRSGITIAGVSGQYPSSAFPLIDGTSTPDLDAATFNAKIKSSAAFEFWDSSGTRHEGSGDADITATHIANGVDVFGATGTVSAGSSATVDPWDIRRGVTVGGVVGKLYVNCRNRVNSTWYNYDGAATAIPNTAVTSGTLVDVWDTIDDYNNNTAGLPAAVVPGWSDHDCGGVEFTPGDDYVWKDVTTAGTGVATCAGSPENCTMKDKITGLEWSKMPKYTFAGVTTVNASPTLTMASTSGLLTGMGLEGAGIPANARVVTVNSATQVTMSANATASAASVTLTVRRFTWTRALTYCDSLTHNGSSDWRVPTQKELMEAYVHGIRSAASTNWIPQADMAVPFWSATTLSFFSTLAWTINFDSGIVGASWKDTVPVGGTCVR